MLVPGTDLDPEKKMREKIMGGDKDDEREDVGSFFPLPATRWVFPGAVADLLYPVDEAAEAYVVKPHLKSFK